MKTVALVFLLTSTVFTGLSLKLRPLEEITGKVVEVEGQTARVTSSSEFIPNPGDKAEIYFEIPGLDEPVKVGSGSVSDVQGEMILISVERATGKVAKGQLVRITSPSPRRREMSGPSSPEVVDPNPKEQKKPENPPTTRKVGELFTFQGFDWPVDAVAFSPDGQQVAAVGNGVKRWDLQTGRLLKEFALPEGTSSAAFSRDGRKVLTGHEAGIVRLWDIESGKELQRLTGHSTTVLDAAFSRDGKQAATCAGVRDMNMSDAPDAPPHVLKDCTVRVWDVESGREIARLDRHHAPVTSVTFSPNGLYVFSTSTDRTIRLWDIQRQTEVQRFTEQEPMAVLASALSPDTSKFVSASGGSPEIEHDIAPFPSNDLVRIDRDSWTPPPFDGPPVDLNLDSFRFRLWDLTTAQPVKLFRGHTQEVQCIAYSPDGRKVVSGAFDRTVRVWDVVSATELAVFSGHEMSVNCVVVSPDGKLVLSGGFEGAVRVWGMPE